MNMCRSGCGRARRWRTVAGMHASDVPAHRRTWSEAEIRELGLRVDLVTACGIAYGVGRSRAWELFHTDDLDFPAFRKGRKAWVPVDKLVNYVLGRKRTPKKVA